MCGGIDSGDPIQLNQGNEYYSPYDAQDNSCGFTIKIENNPNMSYVYQIEYSVTDDEVWYDLSAVDGTLATNRRYPQVGPDGACPYLWCDASVSSCEWPIMIYCAAPDMRFWLC
jgi:hypothetical protein